MDWYQIIVNRVTNTRKAIAYPGFVDVDETVSGSAKSQFNLGIDIDAEHQIDVLIDGRYQLENTAWTRDTVNNRIDMSTNINVGSWFRARVFKK